MLQIFDNFALSRAIEIFFYSFVTGLGGALMPGPLLSFTIHQAAKKGYRVGFLVVLGHGILESSLVMAIFVGAARFLSSQPLLRAVSGVGAVVMCLLAVLMLRDARKLSLSEVLKGGSGNSKIDNPVLGGILMSGLNPTFPLWWATVGLTLVAKFGTTVQNVITFYAGHITSDFLWYVFVSSAVGFGRHVIPDRVYRLFIASCALFLAGFGLYFAFCALTGYGLKTP